MALIQGPQRDRVQQDSQAGRPLIQGRCSPGGYCSWGTVVDWFIDIPYSLPVEEANREDRRCAACSPVYLLWMWVDYGSLTLFISLALSLCLTGLISIDTVPLCSWAARRLDSPWGDRRPLGIHHLQYPHTRRDPQHAQSVKRQMLPINLSYSWLFIYLSFLNKVFISQCPIYWKKKHPHLNLVISK